jgi:hypothetical protein
MLDSSDTQKITNKIAFCALLIEVVFSNRVANATIHLLFK